MLTKVNQAPAVKKYSDEDCDRLLRAFPESYSIMRTYRGAATQVRVESDNVPKETKAIRAFIDANIGATTRHFAVLSDAAELTYNYICQGKIVRNQASWLLEQIDQVAKPFELAAGGYKGNKATMPAILNLPTHAANIVSACEMIEEHFEGPQKQKVFDLLSKRTFEICG